MLALPAVAWLATSSPLLSSRLERQVRRWTDSTSLESDSSDHHLQDKPVIDDYKNVPALRLYNPLTVLARFGRARRGEGDTLGAFLLRNYGPLLDGCDVEVVARSIEEDAAEIAAILEDYQIPLALEHDNKDDVHCRICEYGEPCRKRFENDAADVAMEADAPLLPVMLWMHRESQSSLTDGITRMAECYVKSLEEACAEQGREAREAAEAAILGKHHHIFFRGSSK